MAFAAARIGSPEFHDSEGGHLRPGNLNENSFKPILERAGLPDVRLCGKRATLLLLSGEPATVGSERWREAWVRHNLQGLWLNGGAGDS